MVGLCIQYDVPVSVVQKIAGTITSKTFQNETDEMASFFVERAGAEELTLTRRREDEVH